MNFPRITIDDVVAIRRVLFAYADLVEDEHTAKICRALAERLMEIA